MVQIMMTVKNKDIMETLNIVEDSSIPRAVTSNQNNPKNVDRFNNKKVNTN